MIQYVLSSTPEQIEQILTLQRQNFPENLSTEQQLSEGFVTVKHTADILLKWQEKQPHILAIANNQVVGYALSMLPEFRHDIPVLVPMFEKIDTTKASNYRYVVMGQICIHKAFRGKGIFRGLYNKMKASSDGFDWIVTEVDANNIRSMKAHNAVGFEELMSYQQEQHTWSLIYLPV
jgi:ribosomal protein S18 acetylase RimI-like enzyme